MEDRDEASEKTIDLSNQKLQRLPVHIANDPTFCNVTEINLNNNELAKLENLSNFLCVTKFSASNNKLYRMAAISTFSNLRILDLSHNSIRLIDGIRDLRNLQNMNLSHNFLQEVDFTSIRSCALQTLNLSHNQIASVSNMSHLDMLNRLYLDHNQLSTLMYADKHLPQSIEYLTLEGNRLHDLSELNIIHDLPLLELTIKNNPCIDKSKLGDHYRPYVLNLFMRLRGCDGTQFTDVERVRAEWLYSHGKGHQFRAGQHNELVAYLSSSNLDMNKIQHIIRESHEIGATILPPLSSTGLQVMSRSLDPAIFQEPRETIPSSGALSRSLHCAPTCSESEPGVEEISAPLPAASKLVPVPESLISPMVANIPEIPVLTHKRSELSQVTLPYSPSEMLSTSKLVSTVEETLPPSKLQSIKSITEVARVRKTNSGDRVPLMMTSDSIRPSTPHSSTSSSRSGPITTTSHTGQRDDFSSSLHSNSVEFRPDQVKRDTRDTDTALQVISNVESQISDNHRREIAATIIQKHWRGRCVRERAPLIRISLSRLYEHLQKLRLDLQDAQEGIFAAQKIAKLQVSAITQIWNKTVLMEARGNEHTIALRNLTKKVDSLADTLEAVLGKLELKGSEAHDSWVQTDITAVHSEDSGILSARPCSLPLTSHLLQSQFNEGMKKPSDIPLEDCDQG